MLDFTVPEKSRGTLRHFRGTLRQTWGTLRQFWGTLRQHLKVPHPAYLTSNTIVFVWGVFEANHYTSRVPHSAGNAGMPTG